MLLGLDVGGTNVDVVLFERCNLIEKIKVPTQSTNLLDSVLEGLGQILNKIDTSRVRRLVLSTTLGTNAIVQDRTEPVGVIVIPGPGIDPYEFSAGDYYFPVSGCIDHRGRESHPINKSEILDVASRLEKEGIRQLAVIGKFSVRNPLHENQINELIGNRFDFVTLGHQISGKLNFPRRIATAYLNSAVQPLHTQFFHSVQASVRKHGLKTTPFILKADGGTLTLEASLEQPAQCILSGPAASITGTLVEPPESPTTAVLDIGGTTTDMAILVDRIPLFEPLGIDINGFKTLIRAYKTNSVGIGGDSFVRVESGNLLIGPQRLGPAMAYGGDKPTPTDAAVALGLYSGGNSERALHGIRSLAEQMGLTTQQAAELVFTETCEAILDALNRMVTEINKKPVYTIKELLEGYRVELKSLLLIGGPAHFFAPKLEELSGLHVMVAKNHAVTNAIGAACARTTCAVSVFADTEQGILVAPEEDFKKEIPHSYTKTDVVRDALELLTNSARKLGCYEEDMEIEVVEQYEFNMVRGFYTTGKNIRVTAQIKPGIVKW